MLGHRYFPEGTRTLYIDNTVKLKVDGSIVLDDWLKESDIAFMRHYSRKTVRGEFFVCSAYGLDSQELIHKQFRFYKKNALDKQDKHPDLYTLFDSVFPSLKYMS